MHFSFANRSTDPEQRCDVVVHVRSNDDALTTLELKDVLPAERASAIWWRLEQEGRTPDDTTIVRVELAPSTPTDPPEVRLRGGEHSSLADDLDTFLAAAWRRACIECGRHSAGTNRDRAYHFGFDDRWIGDRPRDQEGRPPTRTGTRGHRLGRRTRDP